MATAGSPGATLPGRSCTGQPGHPPGHSATGLRHGPANSKGSAARSRNLQPRTTSAAEARATGLQQLQRHKLLFGQQHRLAEHDATAAEAGGIAEVEWQHHPERLRAIGAGLQVSKNHAAGKGEQVATVDPIESRGWGRFATGPADLEGRTARGGAEADGSEFCLPGKCRRAWQNGRWPQAKRGGLRRACSSPRSSGG